MIKMPSPGRLRQGITLLGIFIGLLLWSLAQHRATIKSPHPSHQYFAERTFYTATKLIGSGNKYDVRYAPSSALTVSETRVTLVELLNSYASTMQRLGIVTWIAHGALIGFCWNQKLLPWDTDLDAQVTLETLEVLAQSHNYTEFDHPDTGSARRYLLDINPYYNVTSMEDTANRISGRWIDTQNGKYLDITAIYPKIGDANLLLCKDGHRYSREDIFPLRQVELESVNVLIPNEYKRLVELEYGPKALTRRKHHW
ncbi:MAG: hypothetical protein Q9167_003755 [Letrouitia subvulpina]